MEKIEQIKNKYDDKSKNEKIISKKYKNAVAYISVKDCGNEIADQGRLYREQKIVKGFASEQEIKISYFYIDIIPSRLGLKNRIQLNKMLQDLKSKNYDVVLLPRIESISRSTVNTMEIIEQILKYDIDVICCNSNINLTNSKC